MDAPPVDVVDRNRPTVVEVAADTCDQCGTSVRARAYVFASWTDGRSLAYCGHHGTEHIHGLRRAGALVIDLRHLITA